MRRVLIYDTEQTDPVAEFTETPEGWKDESVPDQEPYPTEVLLDELAAVLL